MEETWRETCDRMRLDLSDDPRQLMRKRRNQIRHSDREPNCTLPSFLVAAGIGVAGMVLARQNRCNLQDDGPLQRLGAAIDGLFAKIAPRNFMSKGEPKDWRRSKPADMAARAAYERAADHQTSLASTKQNTNAKRNKNNQAGQKNKKKHKKKGKKR